MRPLFVIGLLGVAAMAYSKAKTIGTLIFYPGQIAGIKWKDGAPFVTVRVAVQNTTSNSLTLNSIAGNIFFQDTLVGNASFFFPQVIPPNSGGYITLDIRMSIIGLVNELVTQITHNNFGGLLTMDGFTNIDGVQFPLDLTFKLGQ